MHIRYPIKTTLLLTCLFVPDVAIYAQSSATGNRIIQPGDHLRITVLSDDKSLSGDFEVAPDSTLKHPLYNQVKVAGIPESMLKERIASFLRRFEKQPQLEVEPLFKVAVRGEVKIPNIYFLPPETTIADAVARAGGTTEQANLDRVTLSREGRDFSVSLNGTNSNPGVATIQSGDQINVTPRRNALSGVTGLAPYLGVIASLLSVTLVVLSHR